MKLYIPVNIKKRKEILDGLGMQEVFATVIMAGIGAVVGGFGMATGQTVVFFFFSCFVGGAAGLVFTKKNRFGQSFLDMVRYYVDFTKRQKRFVYRYYNIYEKEIRNGKTSEKPQSTDGQ